MRGEEGLGDSMVTRIEAHHFRSLRYLSQELSGFQVLVGPNGSGKSTFLDVLALLGDVLKTGPLRALIGDVTTNTPARAADPSHLCWMRQGNRFELAVEFRIPSEPCASGPGVNRIMGDPHVWNVT